MKTDLLIVEPEKIVEVKKSAITIKSVLPLLQQKNAKIGANIEAFEQLKAEITASQEAMKEIETLGDDILYRAMDKLFPGEFEALEVINSGLITKSLYINQGIENNILLDDEIEYLLKLAINKRRQIRNDNRK